MAAKSSSAAPSAAARSGSGSGSGSGGSGSNLSGSLQALAASAICDRTDSSRLSSRELTDGWGGAADFMLSHGLKPYESQDREDALSLSRAYKAADDQGPYGDDDYSDQGDEYNYGDDDGDGDEQSCASGGSGRGSLNEDGDVEHSGCLEACEIAHIGYMEEVFDVGSEHGASEQGNSEHGGSEHGASEQGNSEHGGSEHGGSSYYSDDEDY